VTRSKTYLGLSISSDNKLIENWKRYIDSITSTLSSACYAITVASLMTINILKLVYFTLPLCTVTWVNLLAKFNRQK
jgi:hypothetical protein